MKKGLVASIVVVIVALAAIYWFALRPGVVE